MCSHSDGERRGRVSGDDESRGKEMGGQEEKRAKENWSGEVGHAVFC